MSAASPRRWLFRLVLALPAAAMLVALARGSALAMDLLHPSGETAVRLMILAMLPGPLADVFGHGGLLRLWIGVRRDIGLAAAGYALFHLLLYLEDMGMLQAILDELELPSIWTGWLALAFLLVPASLSSDAAMRRLGRRWKSFQRFVYAALALTLVHWVLIGWEWISALVHLLPLMAAWALRFIAFHRKTLARTMS